MMSAVSQLAVALPDPTRVRRRGRLRVLGLVLVLLAVALAAWWLLRPQPPTLLGRRTSISFTADPRPVSEAAAFGALAFPDPGDREEVLTFHRAPAVHLATNSAAATARVAVCVPAAGETPAQTGYARELGTWCRQVRYVGDGTRVRWGGSGPAATQEYLVVVVTPTRPGRATVDRVPYDYERSSGASGIDVGTLRYTVRAR